MHEAMDLSRHREKMVEEQLKKRGIKDAGVLAAFNKVPREKFVLPQDKDAAYEDHPLPIGSGQTISQPYIVALMTELLELGDTDRVLEIGTGSGYQTAILAELAGKVYTIERIASLSSSAEAVLKASGYKNIDFHVGDGSEGLAEGAPYNGIIVTCAATKVPGPLKEQLADGGRLVIPVGHSFSQALTLIERRKSEFIEKVACGCVFVPLIGKYS